jgi:hypothetical protein
MSLATAALLHGQEADQAKAPVRIALVSAEKGDRLVKVVTLAEVKLTELPGVEMLERSAIDRVLAEHKLTLSGLVAADQAVAVGKLLSVDLFAVVDAGADPKEVGGLVIFDARTGVRLWDAALPAGKLETTVKGVVDGVAAAQHKHDAADKLRPICLLTVRNVDLPREMDSLCDSVGLLLERRLVASPDLAVLERRRLDQVNRERDVPTGSPLHKLKTSVITLELEVGKSEGKGLRGTALLSDGKGKSLGKVTVETPRRDAADLSAALLRETIARLDVRVAPAQAESKREADRFLREGVFYLEHKDPLRALPAMQSARALSAEGPSVRAALARVQLAAANEVLDPGGSRGVGSFVYKVDANILERSLALAKDGSEQLVAVVAEPDEGRFTGWGKVHRMFAETELHNYLMHVNGLREGVSASARTEIEAVRANQGRLHQIRVERAGAEVHDTASFTEYTRQLSGSLFPFLSPGVPAEKWIEGLQRLGPWSEVARKYEDVKSGASRELMERVLFSFRYPRSLSEAQLGQLHQIWHKLAEHPNRTIAVYGKLADIATEVNYRKLSETECQKRVRNYRLFVQKQLEEVRGPDSLRFNLYIAAMDGVNLLMNRAGNAAELEGLTEFMLAHNELAPTIAQYAAFLCVPPRKQDGYRYASSVLRRALAIVDGKEGHFLSYATTPQMLRFDRDRYRKEYRSRLLEYAQADPSLAPELFTKLSGAETLIDVHANKEGNVWLQQPVVADGMVYLAVLTFQDSPLRHGVHLLRLTPGKAERWEGRPVEVSLGFRPWMGQGDKRFRLGISFGTCACVHKGRYYLGTQKHGIFAFPFDDSSPERISTAEGLPSDYVQGLACHDGKLYAYLGEPNKEAYVVAWDIGKHSCDVLASSRRKEKRSPLDDNTPLVSGLFQTDAERSRIVFSLYSPFTHHELNGVWSLDGTTGAFKKLFILHHSDIGLAGPSARIEGDLLRMPSTIGVFDYDLVENDGHLIYAGKVRLEVGPTRSAVFGVAQRPAYRQWTNSSWNARQPFALAGGYIWAAQPFSRRALDGAEPQLLAPLRKDQKHFQPTECLQRMGDYLLAGDSFGLWRVHVPEKK